MAKSKPKSKGKKATPAENNKLLDGKIVWIDREAYNYTNSQGTINTSPIRNAVLSETELIFSASDISNHIRYEVKLIRKKDTNFVGKIFRFENGEKYDEPVDLQVFENRLGLMLEGDWVENNFRWYCFVLLLYV